VLFKHHSKVKKHESEKKKKKAEERCGNGKNTSNYIENMIILCRFLCFRFIKPFCRYTSPSCHTCSVGGKRMPHHGNG
jgi:ribosomal protein S14